jgi:hypothetical protein
MFVVLSSHMTDHGEQSYPQFAFTASDGPCARGVPFNKWAREGTNQDYLIVVSVWSEVSGTAGDGGLGG